MIKAINRVELSRYKWKSGTSSTICQPLGEFTFYSCDWWLADCHRPVSKLAQLGPNSAPLLMALQARDSFLVWVWVESCAIEHVEVSTPVSNTFVVSYLLHFIILWFRHTFPLVCLVCLPDCFACQFWQCTGVGMKILILCQTLDTTVTMGNYHDIVTWCFFPTSATEVMIHLCGRI